MQFNDEQRQAIMSLKPLVLVSAGAGSGKTRILTERFVHLCELRLTDEENQAGATVDEIVAITFTEKGAREMKDRIRKRLAEKEADANNEKARHYWQEQQEALERAHISTFHSFCQRLISQHAMAADLIPQTRVLDDVDARSQKRAIVKSLFGERIFIERAIPLLDVMSKQQLIESMEQIHDDMREFVIGEDAIASIDVGMMLDSQCDEKKLRQLELVQRFHQEAVRCVARFPLLDDLTKAQQNHVVRITSAFSTLTIPDDAKTYMTIMNEIMPKSSQKNWIEKAPALYELHVDHWKPLKDSWVEMGGDVYVNEQTKAYVDSFVFLLKEFARRYALKKVQAGTLDFSDLQQKAVALLVNKPIKEACQRQYRHMMIDEFQDTNRLQLAMLEGIDPQYQFIVGDQKQSIYRFRGANVGLMNEREDLAEKEEWAEAILMNTNYRTSTPIIDAVNELFAHVMTSDRMNSYETVYAPLKVNRLGESEQEKCVELTVLSKEEASESNAYQALANRIIEMVRTGIPHVQKEEEWVEPTWSDIAILIPTRSHLLTLERALAERGIPYVVSGGIGFYSRQEVVDFITLLRWLNRPFEDVHLLAVLRSPLCGLTIADFLTMQAEIDENESLFELVYDEHNPKLKRLSPSIINACEKIRTWLDEWTPFRFHHSLEQVLIDILTMTGFRSSLLLQSNGLQKVSNVEKLIMIISDSNHTELETILIELDERMSLSEKEGEAEVEHVEGDIVQIMTVHASKGLEFPIVILPHLDRAMRGDKGKIRFQSDFGIVFNLDKDSDDLVEKLTYQTPGYPLVKDLADAEAREESKRLFYVAMTRARDYLYMIGEESNSSQTWLQLIEGAMEESELANSVKRTEKSEEQPHFDVTTSFYTAPELIKKREVPLSLSVSEIMLFMNDPLEYFDRFVVGLPYKQKKESINGSEREQTRVDPSLLGTLVHRACELRDHGLTIDGAIVEALNEEDELTNSSEYEMQMEKLMENYSDKQREQLGISIVNEWSFVVTIEGVEVIGEIDKIVKKNEKLVLIDFKTNIIQSSGKELVDRYRSQLFLYKMAYEQDTGETIDSMGLYVLRDKQHPLHMIDVLHEEKEIRTAIQTIKSLKLQKAGKEAYQIMSQKVGL